jgi:hypothetical protein
MQRPNSDVSIHGMCIVKDEADVVVECLTEAARWCDHIYVFDNGSTDGTWELVQQLAEDLPEVVAWKTDGAPFSDGLRAQIFDEFRNRSRPGDWWARVDADEFYVDDPRVFLRKVPAEYRVVWTASFSYYFTDRDAELYAVEPERYADDIPVEHKLRYYVNHWSEPRFFRFRDDIRWSGGGGFPTFVVTSPGYPVRIWVKHFPYRSPQQIAKRLQARHAGIARGVFEHEAVADWGAAVGAVRTSRSMMQRTGTEFATLRWQDRVVPASALDYDAHDRRLAVNESIMPRIPRRTTRVTATAARAHRRSRAIARKVVRWGVQPALRASS